MVRLKIRNITSHNNGWPRGQSLEDPCHADTQIPPALGNRGSASNRVSVRGHREIGLPPAIMGKPAANALQGLTVKTQGFNNTKFCAEARLYGAETRLFDENNKMPMHP